MEFDTKAIRIGHHRTNEGEHSEAIFTTSSYVFQNAAEAAARFAEGRGNIYSRFTNPTVRAFEERLAALEGGARCVASGSGMAAILSTGLALLKSGDHIIVSQSIFGASVALFDQYFQNLGIQVTFVPLTDIAAWEQAIQSNTKMFYLETPSNPLAEIGDIPALAALTRRIGAYLVVDNCFCTPALQQPLALGADIVIHSASKYLDGQGRVIGGAVVGHPEPMDAVYRFLRTAGTTLSPFHAWIFLKGLETLSLRMQAHSAAALTLATWLEQQPGVAKVFYPFLESHPQQTLAKAQQTAGGGIVSFIVEGGQERAWQVIDNCQIFSITANLGDTKSTITHPYTTTHARVSVEKKAAAGIVPGLIRLSVGLEDIKDLRADLYRGLTAKS